MEMIKFKQDMEMERMREAAKWQAGMATPNAAPIGAPRAPAP